MLKMTAVVSRVGCMPLLDCGVSLVEALPEVWSYARPQTPQNEPFQRFRVVRYLPLHFLKHPSHVRGHRSHLLTTLEGQCPTHRDPHTQQVDDYVSRLIVRQWEHFIDSLTILCGPDLAEGGDELVWVLYPFEHLHSSVPVVCIRHTSPNAI